MALEKMADKVIDADLLVIGGGVAGCAAAARAAERGLRVALVEKSKPERSGCCAFGVDHFSGVPTEEAPPEEIVRQELAYDARARGPGRYRNPNVMLKVYRHMMWGVEELEKLGLPMKWDDGKLYRIPNLRGPTGTCLRVHWLNAKQIFGAAVRKRGVIVLDRTTVIDLLINKGAVAGATAVNTRTGEFAVIKARAAIIATGCFARCYEPDMPQPWKYKYIYHYCPASLSGDGWAIAFRAGADIVNMDIGSSWNVGIRDDLLIPVGNIARNDGIPGTSFTWDGDEGPAANWRAVSEMEEQGKTPIYNTVQNLPDDYHKRMEVGTVDQRMLSLKLAEDRGFNFRTHWYIKASNKPYKFMDTSGVYIDENFKSSLNGLYALGDASSDLGGVGNASVSGLMLGESMPDIVSAAAEPVIDEGQVEQQKQRALGPLDVKDGVDPVELECAIRYQCEQYVGVFKSEGKLLEGMRRMRTLRREFLPKLMARSPHFLMRCLETRNIMDLVDLHMSACLARQESRGNYIRADYPEREPARDNMRTHQRLENGEVTIELKEIPDLKSDAEEGK